MLKPISRLRSICKGDLNINPYSDVIIHNRIRKNILHSIPVLSIFVLLGIMGYAIINPSNLADLASLGLLNNINNSSNEVYAADSTSNTSSLIIDNGDLTNSNNTITEGNVTYSSHTVQVSASNINGYSLKITGPTNMTTANTSNPTTITGADNKTPANMTNNTWGYAWGAETTANANMTYNSFTGVDQTLASNSSATSANFTNKLVFAVKFGNDAVAGHYKANVKLNLTVTPKVVTTNYSVSYNMNGGTGGPSSKVDAMSGSSITYTVPTTIPIKTGYKFLGWSSTGNSAVAYVPGNSIIITSTNPNVTLTAVWAVPSWDNITDMQEMTITICKNAAVGAERSLKDTRDNNYYTVRKLTDGKCWMVDNLKLDLSKVTLTSNDSDVTTNYTKGTATSVTTASNWSSSKTLAQWTAQVAVSTSAAGDGQGYQSAYGYYYSWCAAIATTSGSSGTCKNYLTVDAPSSVCSKGWKLPNFSDFSTLYNKFTAATWTTNNGLNGRWLGAALADTGGAFFPAAGYIASTSGIIYPGKYGRYWSRTPYGSTDGADKYAYHLNFYSSNIEVTWKNTKDMGFPVRCIAYSS